MTDRRQRNASHSPERRRANRRAFPRWQANFEVRYGVGKDLYVGTGLEIGEGGMAFTGPKTFPVDTEIDIRYRLQSDDEWIRVRGQVRHLQQDVLIGTEFLNLRLPDRLNIVEFITEKK